LFNPVGDNPAETWKGHVRRRDQRAFFSGTREEASTPQRPEDLKDHDGISFRGFPIAPEWRYRKDGPAFAVEPKTRLAVNTTEAAIDAALANLGIIRVLSYQVADELRSGTLQPLLEEFTPEPLPVSLVYPDASLLAPKIRTFLNWTAPQLRTRLATLG
jgi:DNA-binding transcriptional LysR family regulator